MTLTVLSSPAASRSRSARSAAASPLDAILLVRRRLETNQLMSSIAERARPRLAATTQRNRRPPGLNLPPVLILQHNRTANEIRPITIRHNYRLDPHDHPLPQRVAA